MTNSAQLHGIKFQPMPKRFMVWDKGLGKFLKYAGEDVYDVVLLTDLLSGYNVVEIHEDLVICQSTNLFDRDGKEVFEGDVVSNGDCRAVCKWDNSNAEFDFISIIGHDNTKGFLDEYKVIGHVLSNPDLLEKK